MRFSTIQVAAGLFSIALLAGVNSGCAKKPTAQQEALAARVDAAASKTEAAANKAEAAARSAADSAARAQAAADKAEQMFQGKMRK
jgi:outer membrane murein-binding lipoprotein Lpp